MAAPVCKVEVADAADAIRPIIVQFSNGRLRPEATGDISFELLQNKKGQDKLMVAKTDPMTYRGTSENGTNKYCKHYLAVLDKARRKLKIVPTELFWMNPVIKDSEHSNSSLQITSNDRSKENKQEKVDELTMAFGSKKKKRAMESRIRHQVQSSEVASLMEMTAEQLEASSTSVLEDSSSNPVANLLPTVNYDATSLDRVYDVHELIPSTVLDSLSDSAADLAQATEVDLSRWKVEKKFSQYVLKSISWLPLEEPARSNRSKLLLYMESLIVTANFKSAQVRLKDPYPAGTPLLLKQLLLDNFFQIAAKGRKTMSQQLKDKLCGYILVLGLILDNYQLNMTELLSDVKFPQAKLGIIVRALGARLEKVDNTMWVKVKLPIKPFIESGRPMSKKKRK